MATQKNIESETVQNVLHDEGGEIDYWKLAEEKNIRQALSLSYTDRFKMMIVLMRVDNTLSKAKITHKQMP